MQFEALLKKIILPAILVLVALVPSADPVQTFWPVDADLLFLITALLLPPLPLPLPPPAVPVVRAHLQPSVPAHAVAALRVRPAVGLGPAPAAQRPVAAGARDLLEPGVSGAMAPLGAVAVRLAREGSEHASGKKSKRDLSGFSCCCCCCCCCYCCFCCCCCSCIHRHRTYCSSKVQ